MPVWRSPRRRATCAVIGSSWPRRSMMMKSSPWACIFTKGKVMGCPVGERDWRVSIREFHPDRFVRMLACGRCDPAEPAMKKTRFALTALLLALSHATLAAAQPPSLCQPSASKPTATALLAAAERHLADRPNPLAHVHTEGTLPHHGIREQSIAAEKDWPVMRQAALAWRLSGDPRSSGKSTTTLARGPMCINRT